MAILNPDHLLEQADRLILPPPAGPPRQVDLRRAISSAYYAAFHMVVTTAADEFVGVTLRASREHALVMRAIDHRTIRIACSDLLKPTPPLSYHAYLPSGGFGTDVMAFARTFPALQEERHAADYDSLRRYVTADAKAVVASSRAAIGQLRGAAADDRKAFLYLILFPPRR